jgi:ligand-binding sensor domain-containing protein
MRALAIFCFLLLSCLPGFSQEDPFIFSHYSEKDGLIENGITCFLKGSEKTLWVGTWNGLNKFDGSHFNKVRNSDSASANTQKSFFQLCEDGSGNLWAATENGIFRFNTHTGRFKVYNLPGVEHGRIVSNIICGKDGTIWATGILNLVKYDPGKDAFTEVYCFSRSPDSINFYQVGRHGLLEDPNGAGIWMVNRKGLYFLNFKSGGLQTFFDVPALRDKSLTVLSPARDDNFWIFDNTSRALLLFDPKLKKLSSSIDLKKNLPYVFVNAVFQDNNNRVWISSWTNQIFVVDLDRDQKLFQLRHRPGDTRSIASEFFWDMMQDSDGTLWLGTQSGISKCNPEKNLYRVYGLSQKIPLLDSTSISIVTMDPLDSSIWLATHNKRLINYHPVTGSYRIFDVGDDQPEWRGKRPGGIRNIRFYKDLLILGATNGLWQVSRDGKMAPFQILPSYKASMVSDMQHYKDSLFYFIGSRAVLYWNKFTKEERVLQYDNSLFPNGGQPMITYFNWHPERNRNAWLASGLGWVAEVNGTAYKPFQVVKDPVLEMIGYTNSLVLDNNDDLWMAYVGVGLFQFNTRTHQSRHWNEKDGLLNPFIKKLAIDNLGKVWGFSANKISIFSPSTSRFFNFSIPIAESNPGYFNSVTKLANGNLLASINNELVELYPDKLHVKPISPKPVISMLNVSGKDILISADSSMELETEQNSLRFSYGMLTDKSIFLYYFEYQLEGFDKKWVRGPADDEAVYNNLKPGTYTFKLRAKGGNGNWESPISSFQIVIKTPYYSTLWFRSLMVLIAIGVIAGIYRYRLSQKEQLMKLENKAQMLEKEKAMAMYENLKQQLNPHFLFNSLTSLSSLIITEPKKAKEFLESLSKTYRYILKSREHEMVALSDEIKFAENYVMLQKTRFEDGFNVNFNIPEEYYHRKIVPVTLQNLVENAIKHNIIDQDSPLVVDIFVEDDHLVVRNNLQKKNVVESSNRVGLANMQSLYQYLSERRLQIIETSDAFTVKIPLI